MKVCLGGTFDILHKGHKLLIDKAFEVAGEEGIVYIGISKGDLAEKKGEVNDYEMRVKKLEEYLERRGYENYVILPLHDKYGLTLEEDFDAIVVSEETLEVAKEINEIRKKKGMKEMKIIKIPIVLAEDGKPISSSRIRKGEIDEEGRLLK